MNRLRIALIHLLGGVDKPLPMTIATPMNTSASNSANFFVRWTDPPQSKRWWQ